MDGKNIQEQLLVRELLEKLIRQNGDDFASISQMLGKNPAYIQQFIRRGTPRKLDEADRRKIADFYKVDEHLLGAGSPVKPANIRADSLITVRQLQIGASAGAGSLSDDEANEASMAFGPQWLKRLTSDPSKLSLISVDGDSMEPTLFNGDDIMVDHGAAQVPLRDGIYVLRKDDVLLVKRIALRPDGGISVRSDNPQYPGWDNVDVGQINIIGRVVWTARRL